jgi:hypothetical protein
VKKFAKTIGLIIGGFIVIAIAGATLGNPKDDTEPKSSSTPLVQKQEQPQQKVEKTQVPKDQISKENYDKIKTSYSGEGDSPAEDILLLGNPTANENTGNTKTLNWKSKDGKVLIIVQYINLKAVTKEIHDGQ